MSLNERLHRLLSERVNGAALGVVRMVTGLAAIYKAFDQWPVLQRAMHPDLLRVPFAIGPPGFGPGTLFVLMSLWMASAVAFAAGWMTRLAGLCLAGTIGYVMLLDQQLYSNHLYLLFTLILLLCLANAGASHSIDARRGGRRPVARWPIILLKTQISILYFFAGINKINLAYISGTVLAGSWRWGGPYGLPAALRTWQVLSPLAILSIMVELFLAAALWSKRWRKIAFVAGLALHGGIVLTMSPVSSLSIFAIVSLAPYLLFLEASPASRTVIWDGQCAICRRWIRLFRRLDWLGVHRFVAVSRMGEDAMTALPRGEGLRLVGPGGEDDTGFRAVRAILELLPVSFLWAPLLRLPILVRTGDGLYRHLMVQQQSRRPARDRTARREL